MEPYNLEESINSSEERVDDQPSDQNDLGVGRSYECVFCKRGFNTAQALGGHMNIHRKDRLRNKPTSNSNKQEENHYLGPRVYQQIIPAAASATCNYQSENYKLSYATYFPEPSTSNRSHFVQKQPQNPLMNEDWRLSLSLDFNEKISEKEELDLELRLGYDY